MAPWTVTAVAPSRIPSVMTTMRLLVMPAPMVLAPPAGAAEVQVGVPVTRGGTEHLELREPPEPEEPDQLPAAISSAITGSPSSVLLAPLVALAAAVVAVVVQEDATPEPTVMALEVVVAEGEGFLLRQQVPQGAEGVRVFACWCSEFHR